MIITLVLLLGITLQFFRSEYVLKFQGNESLARQTVQESNLLSMEVQSELEGSNYCVVYNSSEEYSKNLSANAIKSLEYMQKKVVVIDSIIEQPNLAKCNVIILATNEIKDLGTTEGIEEYVYKGGYVFFMSYLEIDAEYKMLHKRFGVTSFSNIAATRGINLTSNVLISENNLSINEDFMVNTSVVADLDDNVELLAESEKKVPLLWKREYGKGAFMNFNGSFLTEKMNRGFFTGALSMLEPEFIYTVFNTKVFFVDDFPAPIQPVKNKQIYDEFNRDNPSFYKEIWWPNMLKISRQYNLKYTGGIVESYNNLTQPPFDSPGEIDEDNLISFGKEIIKSGGELAFHGYNHQSLVTDLLVSNKFGYKAWNSEEDMTKAIEELVSYTKSAFPSYTVTAYIPPSNVLSLEGRTALKKGWSDLKVISSLYGEDGAGLAYIQEFEVAKDNIIEMPRITSGYVEDKYNRWAEANTMTGIGVFSHFVHPDDVISRDRANDMRWGELYSHFNNYMDRVHETYPWTKSMTATEAALNIEETLQTQVNWRVEDDSISASITNFKKETSYIFRTEKKLKRLHDCEVLKIDDDVYLVTVNSSEFKIDLE